KLLFCNLSGVCEGAAYACGHPQKLEVVGSHSGGGDALRITSSGHYQVIVRGSGYFLEEMTLFTQCGEFRRGKRVPVRALFRIFQRDYNYARRVFDRRIAQQDAAHDTENRGIQADAQAECEDIGNSKSETPS